MGIPGYDVLWLNKLLFIIFMFNWGPTANAGFQIKEYRNCLLLFLKYTIRLSFAS